MSGLRTLMGLLLCLSAASCKEESAANTAPTARAASTASAESTASAGSNASAGANTDASAAPTASAAAIEPLGCDLRKPIEGEQPREQCFEYPDSRDRECKSGTPMVGGCPKEGALATCKLGSVTHFHYDRDAVDSAKTTCNDTGGNWTEL